MNNVVIIRHASSHHSGFSGYAQLLKYLPVATISGSNSYFPYRISKFITERIDKSTGLYDSLSLLKEIELIWKMIIQTRGLSHFLNGERDIRYSTYFKNLRHWQQIATFHKPPSILKTMVRDPRYISKLDGAIAVGINQVDYLTKVFGIERVRFIPHGVDTNFFIPDSSKRDVKSAIFVGYHLRDFKLLQDVIDIIARRIPDFKLHVVGDQNVFRLFTNQTNIVIHSNVNNEKLLDMYQQSSLLVLPLYDVTACNTILEAMACGLPIVTTQLEGHQVYLNSDNSIQTRIGNSNDMAEAVIELLENSKLNLFMGASSRVLSLNFSWPIISNAISEFYKKFE